VIIINLFLKYILLKENTNILFGLYVFVVIQICTFGIIKHLLSSLKKTKKNIYFLQCVVVGYYFSNDNQALYFFQSILVNNLLTYMVFYRKLIWL